MSGIGIEFRRFFTKHSVIDTLRGISFSLMTTLVPILVVVLVLLGLFSVLNYDAVRYASRELMSATILYSFVFSLIINAGFGNPISRYVANMIYQEDYGEVQPAFYAGLTMTVALSALVGIPFCLREVLAGGVDPLFALASYGLFMSVNLAFYAMVFMSAVKDFKRMAIFYATGMALTFVLGVALVYLFRCEVTLAIIAALAGGFLLIAILMYGFVSAFFTKDSGHYARVLPYFRKWWKLLLANLFYAVGLFCHNFVFWQSGLKVTVANSFVCAPLYDKAACIAMYTNLFATVIFIVQTESHFVGRYRHYSEMVISGRLSDIRQAQTRMFRMLGNVVMSVAELQFITTVGLFLLFMYLMPRIGFYGLTMSIYPCLTAGYFAVYIMYAQLMYLYYFEDDPGALGVSATFCLGTLICSFLARQYLSITWYGLGLFGGAFLAWNVGYFRLKWLIRTFDAHIFCTGYFIPVHRSPMPSSKVYDREARPEAAQKEGIA